MELKRLKCPTCGASIDGNTIDLTLKTAKCPACDETFIIEQAENFALVEVDKTKDIANYRRNLAVATEKDDAEGIKKYAEKILDILPEDYEAGYFYAYANAKNGDSRYLYDFYKDFDREYTEESCMRVAEHIVRHGELRDNVLIEKYLKNLKYSADSYLSYYKQVFNDKLSKEELYDDITRDVFICHRSIDGKVAERIVKELEDDGNKCWISSRNLRPNDNENYWDNIKRAIKSCRIFLVVSSRDAMLSTDVKKEMAVAKDLNKKRLEVKIDDSEHNSLFKDFFDGCKWIKGENYEEIKTRIADLLLNEVLITHDYRHNDKETIFTKEITNLHYSKGLNIVDGVLKDVGTCEDVDIIIPDEVVKIDDNAFARCKQCHNIIISDKVKVIGSNAFLKCKNLERITIGKNIIEIGNFAFSECNKLKSIYYWGSASQWASIEGLENILCNGGAKNKKLFLNNKELKNIKLEGISTIKPYAFYGCSSLTDVFIAESVTEICENAFYGCGCLKTYKGGEYVDKWLIRAMGTTVIKDDTIGIANSAFEYSGNVTKINIPNGVRFIGKFAFRDCKHIETIFLPDGVKVLGERAFENCWELKRITIPKSVEKIGQGAFLHCSGLKELIIENGVEDLGIDTFYGCYNLKTVFIPESVNNLDDACACFAEHQIDIIVDKNNATYYIKDGILYNKKFKSILYVTKNISGDITISDDIRVLGVNSFRNCKNLKRVNLPDSITVIGARAFENCDNLVSIKVGQCLEHIGNNAFSKCLSLTDVYYKGTASQWSQVKGASNLLLGDLKPNLNRILYVNNKPLTEIKLENINEVKAGAFYGCSLLEKVSLSEGVAKIDYYAFKNCCNLTDVSIPSSIQNIGEQAFYKCSNLMNINYSGTIGQWINIEGLQGLMWNLSPKSSLYINNNLLTEITLNERTKIQPYAFYCCDSIKEVKSIENVTSIGENAFALCSNLESINIGDSVEHIETKAFYECKKLRTIILGSGIKKIGCSAFGRILNLSIISELKQTVRIFYNGTISGFRKIMFDSNDDGNYLLDFGRFYFYSKKKPQKQGNYWHYVDDKAVVWE